MQNTLACLITILAIKILTQKMLNNYEKKLFSKV